jgi:hypothetical protein
MSEMRFESRRGTASELPAVSGTSSSVSLATMIMNRVYVPEGWSRVSGEPIVPQEQGVDVDLSREAFFQQLTRDYAALKNDPQAWAAECKEEEAWDATIADGLPDE